MIILQPINLRWITGVADDPADLCAHGDVEFRIQGESLFDDSESDPGRNLTVSAAALFLLRTLSKPRRCPIPGGELLFPCCGHVFYDVPGEPEVCLLGCPNGVDFDVLHEADGPGVLICANELRQWSVNWTDWRQAVFHFTDRVWEFYSTSSPKRPEPDMATGFSKFVAEWERRRGQPSGIEIV